MRPLHAPGTLALISPDDAAWDAFVEAHPHGHMLQSSAWGALKSRAGWQPLRLAVVTPTGMTAGCQALIRRRLGLAAVYVPRGPLFSADQAANDLLLGALIRAARRRLAVFVRIEPNLLEAAPEARAVHSWLLCHAMQPTDPIQPRSSLHLDLAPSPERLLAGMSKGHRADIRRAERQGVTVRAGATPADLQAFQTILEATGKRQQFGVHSPAYYAAAYHLFGPAAQLLIANQHGQPVAAHMVFGWGREAAYLYGGSLPAGLEAGANHAVQWHAIRWARERGCARYDLWGIPDALGQANASQDASTRAHFEQRATQDPLMGVYRFKKGFGATVVRYLPAYDYVLVRPAYRLWQRRVHG